VPPQASPDPILLIFEWLLRLLVVQGATDVEPEDTDTLVQAIDTLLYMLGCQPELVYESLGSVLILLGGDLLTRYACTGILTVLQELERCHRYGFTQGLYEESIASKFRSLASANVLRFLILLAYRL